MTAHKISFGKDLVRRRKSDTEAHSDPKERDRSTMNHKAQWLESKHTQPCEEKNRDPTNPPEIQRDLSSSERLIAQEEREGEERELLKEEELVISMTSPRNDAAKSREEKESA